MTPELLGALRDYLERSVVKKPGARVAAVALSTSGERYFGAVVESDTNLVLIPAEQVAIGQAVLANDYSVTEVVALAESLAPGEAASPLVLKILADFARRVPQTVTYTVLGPDGDLVFTTADVLRAFPFYAPERITLARTQTPRSANHFALAPEERGEAAMLAKLRQAAIAGLEKNFPLYDSASGYGAAVCTTSGTVYFAGQYSSPDKRLNVHAEMNALLSAVMRGDTTITHIGIVSSKFLDTPCDMCGVCRQFIAEIAAKFNFSPVLVCFAKEDAAKMKTYSLAEYLPSVWSSKNWSKS